jgi:ParB-like chromosome segregation protein Spo0J
MVSVESLVFDPANARKHDERNIKAIMDSLERHGQRKPIVCYSNMVVAGNGTLQAAKRLGWTEIWVNDDGFKSIADAKAYAIQDNRSAELAAWDDVVLGDTLTELKDAGWDLEEIGFNDGEIKAIMSIADEIDLPDLKSGDKEPFQQMAFVLSDEQADTVKQAIEYAKKNEYLDDAENKNANGNAIFAICQKYIGE